MFKIKRILMLTLVLVGLVAMLSVAAAPVEQTSSLSGIVLSDSLAKEGDLVKEGQILVQVMTIAGPAPAARASVDGRVTAVLVKPGDKVAVGQALVRLESAR